MRFRQVVLSLLLLFVTLALSMPINAEVGMGVSDYNAKPEILRGKTERFPVARVYNTGNETFIVTITAELDSNNSGIKLTVDPEEVILKPDETCLIYLIADCSNAKLGTYPFTLEIQPIVNGSNMVVPAAVATGEITVVNASSELPSKPQSQNQNFRRETLLIAGVCSSLIAAYAFARRKRRNAD